MQIIVSNEQDKIDYTDEYQKLLTIVLEEGIKAEHKLDFDLADVEVELSVLLVDDKAIHELNKEYRAVDRPTDVLSFPLFEENSGLPGYPLEKILLGDLVISLETAQRQAEEYGHSLERELGFLTIHGLLHLLGYDHETELERSAMRELEEMTLAKIGLTR